MAYKSLIDYYGGGMVRPSQGYQLGGMVSSFGIKSAAETERRDLKKKMEEDRRRREKGGSLSFIGGLLGTAVGGAFGQPQLGGTIGSGAGQYLQEKQYKPVDVSGGLYALDIKKDIAKGQREYKGGGAERIGMAGLMGYMGGGEGGMYQSILDAPKKLAATAAEKAATTAATTAANTAAAGAVAPTAAGAATKETAQAALTPLESGKQYADEYMERVRAGEAGMAESSLLGGESTYAGFKLDPSSAIEPSGLAQSLQLPSASGAPGMGGDPYSAFSTPVPQLNPPNIPLFSPAAPSPSLAYQGQGPPESLMGPAQQQTQMAGGLGTGAGTGTGGGYMSGILNMLLPSLSMPRIGPNRQDGGLVDYMMPQGYQGGGQVGSYGTATDPLQALQQMGMGDVASDPRLGDYVEDLPKFEMGYKQKIGDIYSGARSSLKQGRAGLLQTSAGQTFQQSGAVSKGMEDISTGLEKGVATGRRGEVENWQADLLSALDRIQGEAGIEFGVNAPSVVGGGGYEMQAEGIPEGWPSRQAFDDWTQSGADPNAAVNYGWQATTTGATPGDKASDARVKSNIDYLFSLDNGIPIYLFKYIGSDELNIGTIAQEAEKIIPEAVIENAAGIKYVNYDIIYRQGV